MQLSNRLLVEGLAVAGASVDLHVFSENLNRELMPAGIQRYNHFFRPHSPVHLLACALVIVRASVKLQPDAVLLLDESMVRSLGLLPWVLRLGPRFVSVNSGATPTRSNVHVRGRLNAYLVRRGYRWLDRLIVAQSTAANLPKVCPEVAPRLRILGRPVPECFYKSISIPPQNFKSFFSCARAEHGKGIDLILRALAALRDEAGQEVAQFCFAGDGTALSIWRNLADDLGLTRVRFFGRLSLEELAPYYQSSYMAIFPAHGAIETFGRTWIEAFASGRPVISTTIDNLNYLVVDGVNGIVIEPTVESVCRGLRRALELSPAEYESMCQEARKTAEPYRQKEVVRQLLSMLEETV